MSKGLPFMARLPAPAGFVSAADVRQQLGLTYDAWIKRIRSEGLTVYGHPSDKRVQLLREADAQILLTPQPVNHPGMKPKAVAR